MKSSHWNGITEVTGVSNKKARLAAQFAQEPSHLDICTWVQSGTSSCEISRRPAKLDFWRSVQSEPGRRADMASRPPKSDFWLFFSIRAWTRWHGQQGLHILLFLEHILIRASHGQQAFKVWLWVFSLIGAWTRWTWPAGPSKLDFLGHIFDQSLDNVTWPAGLRSLTFGEAFNQRLDNVTWPAGLQRLTFGKNFQQSLGKVTWPAGLQSLTLGYYFNHSLVNVTWPAGMSHWPGCDWNSIPKSGFEGLLAMSHCPSFDRNPHQTSNFEGLRWLRLKRLPSRLKSPSQKLCSEQGGPAHYVNWSLTILHWGVEKKIRALKVQRGWNFWNLKAFWEEVSDMFYLDKVVVWQTQQKEASLVQAFPFLLFARSSWKIAHTTWA